MSDATGAIQVAIYTALSAASPSLVVYDQPIPDVVPPYVLIGETTAIDAGTKTKTGQEHTITLHFWSTYDGTKEVHDMFGEAYALLHEASLSIAGFTCVFCRFEFSDVFEDQDGQTWHGVQRYRILTEPL